MLRFLSKNGTDPATNWQIPPVPGNQIWRGSGLTLHGNIGQPSTGKLNIEFFEMNNTTLDGLIEPTGLRGDPNTNNGIGWDQTHKCFRLQDTIVGDVLLENVEFVRWSGEILYGAGQNRTTITRNCWFHKTDGDAHNWANNARLSDFQSRIGEAYQAFEVSGGPGSCFIGTEAYNCVSAGGMSGGLIGGLHDGTGATLPGTTYIEAQRPADGSVPWIELDIYLNNDAGSAGAGSFYVMNWTRGRIHATDTVIHIDAATARYAASIDLEISAWVDRFNVGSAVYIDAVSTDGVPYNGSNRSYERPSNVRVRLSCGQTERARANGIMFQSPIGWGGLMGSDVSFILEKCTAAHFPAPDSFTTPSMPLIDLRNLEAVFGVPNIELAAPGNNVARFVGPVVSFSAGGATGDYVLAIDPAGYHHKQIVDVFWYGGASTLTFNNGSGVRLTSSFLRLVNNQKARFQFNKPDSKWDFVDTWAYQ